MPSLRSLALLLAASTLPALASSDPLGLFTDHTDVGNVLHPGATKFNAEAGTYTITGSGENMWFAPRRLPVRLEAGRGRRRHLRRHSL